MQVNIPDEGLTKDFIQKIIENMTANDAAIVIEQAIKLKYKDYQLKQ